MAELAKTKTLAFALFVAVIMAILGGFACASAEWFFYFLLGGIHYSALGNALVMAAETWKSKDLPVDMRRSDWQFVACCGFIALVILPLAWLAIWAFGAPLLFLKVAFGAIFLGGSCGWFAYAMVMMD